MGEMRLQRFLARAGVASRRKSEELISSGQVIVNGSVVTELGSKVDPDADVVEFDGNRVQIPHEGIVIMLNKPEGYLTAMADERGGRVVSELVPVDEHPSLFPVGRLDRDTTGLLLFTTDGELGHALLHPSRHVDKSYVAKVSGKVTEAERRQLEDGVQLEDGMTSPARCEVVSVGDDGTSVVRLVIHEGRKRQVRRMLKAVGHDVLSLERESFGPLSLGNLPKGSWRELTESECEALRCCTSSR